jgi:predicted ester cyclase
MSVNENKHLSRKYIEEVINTGNVEHIDQYVSPDYAEIFDGKCYSLGIEGARQHILSVRNVYPDLTLTIDRQIAEGQYVATCFTARGTHQGTWLGIKPTGKAVTYVGVNVDKVVDGKITEHSGAVNLLGPLLEIGAVRVVGTENAQ